jgi:eukaryotic-like serine/threonine-protein kinase
VGTLPADTIFADRYKILGLIGSGGMGHVYRAEHVALKKPIALKLLGRDPNDDSRAEREARFEREARAIARLQHAGCVRILDYGRSANGYQYIAMELLDGESLYDALNAGPFSIARAVFVTRNLLAALAHAHRNGVLHRDVKPENVVLVSSDVPRTVLVDFGLARLRDDGPLTAAGMCMGSPSYIAPERLQGQPYDARCDLYAVGVILYEMLAGIRPFVGSTAEEIMYNSVHRPPRPLRAMRDDIPSKLDTVVRRALAKDPDRRFADAEEMLSALEAIEIIDEPDPATTLLGRDLVVTQRLSMRARASISTIGRLALVRRSLWSRLWGWLRYGRWRWARTTETSR